MFFYENTAKFIVLGINSIHFILILFNRRNFLSQINFEIRVAKSTLGTFLSAAICINNSAKSIIITIAAYCLLLLVLIEIIEGLVKIVLLVLINKRIIADIPPIETAEIALATRKEEKVELFNTLDKAKQELKDVL